VIAPTLQIRLLGEFNLTWRTSEAQAPVTTLNTPRLQSLLAYLVLHRDAPQSRRHLAFCLWSDLREERARANLRKLFYQLQRALPEPDRFLSADAQTLQWRPDAPFSLDVADFESATSRTSSVADLQRAADLYRGELLPGCYDDWIVPERERLRQMLMEVLEWLIQLAEDARNYPAAIGSAQRLLQHDPLREETHRRLIGLHALNDDRAAALRAYHTCASVLQRELGVEPSPATREVYERLLNSEFIAPLAATFPLVGRGQEWTQLLAAWRAASAGHPHMALLTGEAGIGKTRLAEELFAWANRQGIRTVMSHCYSAEGTLAYAPVVTWLRACPLPKLERVWLTEVARLLPELLTQHPDLPSPGPLTEAWQRQRLHEALSRAVLGSGAPLLLVIDDLQWCGRDTLEWLHYLLRFDGKARLFVLGTLRPEEVLADHPVAALRSALCRDRRLTEIAVGPLDADATAQLAMHVSGRELSSEAAARLYQGTEGNPLFIVESLRAGATDVDVMGLTPTIQAVISARFSQLSPKAHELMNLAATIGREFNFSVLKYASGDDDESLVPSLDELWQRRIVRETGATAYDFTHGKLRHAAYADLSAARRRLLHRHVAEALEVVHIHNLDSVSGQVAVHYEQAGLTEQAIPYYRHAAEAARRVYANQDALTYLSHALELTPQTAHAERYDLLLAREKVHDLLAKREAQTQDISALKELAATLGDDHRRAEVALCQAQYAERIADYAAATMAARTAIGLAQTARDAQIEALGYLLWGNGLRRQGALSEAHIRYERALTKAKEAKLSEIEADSLCGLGSIADDLGHYANAQAYREQALRLFREIGDQRGECHALNALASTGLGTGDYIAAQAYLDQALHLSRQIGDRRSEIMASANLSACMMWQGNYADARIYSEQALPLSRETGDRLCEFVALCNLGCIADYQGDYIKAQAHYEQSLRLCREIGRPQYESEIYAYLGLLFHHMGNDRAARENSQQAVHIAQSADARYEQGLALTHLGHALAGLGQLSEAAEAYGQAVALRRELGQHNLAIESLAGLARVALTQGDVAQAVAHVQEILSYLEHHTLDGTGEPLRVCLTCYRVLQAARDPRTTDVLKTAYSLLQAQVDQIPDASARRAFLENVAVHREIVEAWRAVE